ncbi:MAG: 50S ribosomal protein L9 [Rhodospirillales bacterium]|jgi:large subunit ribosomal protein L9|nr:50S ribosomal protein L9 [Rhodospirillales bacterium]
MQIILLERVEHLGQMGDLVNVRPGYARNYLIPQRKAAPATEENRKRFEAQRAQLEARNLERRKEAEAVAVKLNGLSVTLIRQAGDSGQLYGSATAADIAAAVTNAGFSVGRSQIRLNQPIKSLGLHTVSASLHPEVIVSVQVNVARTADEAEIQARGGDISAPEDEREDEREELSLEEELEAMTAPGAGDYGR